MSSSTPASEDEAAPFMNAAEVEALSDRLDAAEPVVDEADVATAEDFSGYGPIIALAIIPAMVAALLVQWVVAATGAPKWVNGLVAGLYVTLPASAFLVWSWNKVALRLPNGRLLRREDIRRQALSFWGLSLLWTLYQIFSHGLF